MIEFIVHNWLQIVAVIIAIYEAVARIFPTIYDYTLIGNIIRFLKWISDTFNRKKIE